MNDSFVKVIPPGGYDFGEPITRLIKVASSGLRGNDLREFVKRAGHLFADQVNNLYLKPGDVPVHIIALGATEFYGPNRNGDGFKEASCKKYHPTFVKHARCYRNHQNKNPDKSYGYIKLSHYNERMRRIELLAIYNSTKEAAARNGGLVADEEMEKIAAGLDIPVSMACKVPFDTCSSCGNKARNRDEYCRGIDEGGLCKAGGLYNRIATVTGDDDNPILHADNEDPLYFDLSKVGRGADRIAFSLGQVKAAGAVILGGAKLAEEWGVTAPAELETTGRVAEMLKIARKLADIEDDVAKADRWSLAFVDQPRTEWCNHNGRLGDALQALTAVKIAMPVEGFLEMVSQENTKSASAADAVKAHLPGIYGRLVKSGEIIPILENNVFVPSQDLAPLAVRRWAEKKASAFSLEYKHADSRVMRNALYHEKLPDCRKAGLVKSAGASAELAKHYAAYKIAFLHSLQRRDSDLDLTTKLCVVQNYV